eukprot:TRINITY_DN23925_c0_g1_i2.p1 TRINITY_DN23925_c0_g1~~TRINITY_DN23925_c0_g1_i2.p1  ORF type:complete len:486 (-),score=81.31 TRINITY_DN23925_c0_g1_i2:252-1709(-)
MAHFPLKKPHRQLQPWEAATPETVPLPPPKKLVALEFIDAGTPVSATPSVDDVLSRVWPSSAALNADVRDAVAKRLVTLRDKLLTTYVEQTIVCAAECIRDLHEDERPPKENSGGNFLVIGQRRLEAASAGRGLPGHRALTSPRPPNRSPRAHAVASAAQCAAGLQTKSPETLPSEPPDAGGPPMQCANDLPNAVRDPEDEDNGVKTTPVEVRGAGDSSEDEDSLCDAVQDEPKSLQPPDDLRLPPVKNLQEGAKVTFEAPEEDGFHEWSTHPPAAKSDRASTRRATAQSTVVGTQEDFDDHAADRLSPQMVSTSTARDGNKATRRTALFPDKHYMAEMIVESSARGEYNVMDYYKGYGWCQAVARNQIFEWATLAVISFNALWIAIDADYNNAAVLVEAAGVFQVMENFFCIYFFIEISVRYGAFVRSADAFTDAWFVFDFALVIMLVVDTWVMSCVYLLFLSNANSGQASLGPHMMCCACGVS